MSCACTLVAACDPRCTCINIVSSYGCQRCATYGSNEQRKKRAEWLAEVIDAARKALLTQLGADDDQ